MKAHNSPPATLPDVDNDGAVPPDFPVPDEVLDLIEEAALSIYIGIDETNSMNGAVYEAQLERFKLCRELTAQLCLAIQQREEVHETLMARSHVLTRYRNALAMTGWTSVEEAYWIAHRMALNLGWVDLPIATSPWLS